jgi:hypothetical protein
VRALDVDPRVTPVRAQEPDGFVHPRAARGEILAEGFVFRFLPAHPDTEPHPAAGERVERAHLLGHEGRLALRQHAAIERLEYEDDCE